MKNRLQRSISGWLEAARKTGFLLVLAAGSAALGFLISWPLWLFATSARQVYTVTVLALAGAGIVTLIVRSALRSRGATRDPGKPRRTFVSAFLTFLMVIVGFGGAYLAAAFLARGLWIIGAVGIAAWGVLLWALGRARNAAKSPKVRTVPAENGSK